MDSGLNENQTELGIPIFAVPLEMFPHSDRFLDQTVQIFGEGWSKTFGFEDAENFVASEETDLSNSVRVTKDHSDL